jgi:hypothetical protein
MAVVHEELVVRWLNQRGFFTMREIKCGIDGIDLLAIKLDNGKITAWHVEVQIIYRPVGYIGGDTSAKKQDLAQLADGVAQWMNKKFLSEKKINKRNAILADMNWEYVLVCAELKDEHELALVESLGVKVLHFRKILADLSSPRSQHASSLSSDIIDLLRYDRGEIDGL